MRCAQFVPLHVIFLLLLGSPAIPSETQAQVSPLSLNDYSRMGNRQTAARKVNDGIYLALGFSNTFLVRTDEGNVVIDTSSPVSAKKHYELLRKVSDAPVRYLILTHGHPDHTGGLRYWMEPQTKLVVQQNYIEFHSYQERLKPYLGRTGAAQFGLDPGMLNAFRVPEKHFEPAITFGDKYEFVLGGTKFEVLSAPGETYDHLCVWVPKYKAAFVGDNYYESFPNIYTLRGTKPRWALDYVASLNKILALEPEIVLPSHGEPVVGKEKIVERLTRYRDAILYVHDATVKGMNEGKDVFTLMREVKLPPELNVGEAYGKVDWSVRGIFDGYVGWFDLNPASMYDQPPTAAEPELVRMAGGPTAVAARAKALAAGDPVTAVRLADAALLVDAKSKPALEAKLAALKSLQGASRNLIEGAWLTTAIRETNRALASAK
ncbi:MAG TPA: MBL fold metallo-hydrolase [Planctomycetaceae bacterium]|jgi:alkyl sulfatase BDS1-like metallo-beta-lactamase superfamily hydrolase|nr:MBL fold metallo-hydrolase [Planctomycetaceae bacterium]